ETRDDRAAGHHEDFHQGGSAASARAARRLAAPRARRFRRRRRLIRLRQIDADVDPRPARPADQRALSVQRPGRRRIRCPAAGALPQRARRLRLPGVSSPAAHERARQRRTAAAVRAARQYRRPRAQGAGGGRPYGSHASHAIRALGRTAAARGHRPRAGQRARSAARRRANRQPRRALGAGDHVHPPRSQSRGADDRAGHTRHGDGGARAPSRAHRGRSGAMNRAKLITHSLSAISRYKLRSSFIILGTLIGTAALTLVIAAGDGAKRKMISTMRQLFGASSIMVMSGGTQFMGGPGANAARLTLDDIEAVASEVREIEAWDPQQAMPNASVRYNGKTATARVFGASERFSRVWERGITRGEAFDAPAVRRSARVALIAVPTARELFGGEDPLGSEIQVGNIALRVIGVLEPFGTDLHGMDRDAEIVIPISTMMRRVMNVDTIAAAKLLVRDP